MLRFQPKTPCCESLAVHARSAASAAAITLADIVEAVEGPIALAVCIDGDCAMDHDCRVKPHWPLVNQALRGALAGVPLTRLAQLEVAA